MNEQDYGFKMGINTECLRAVEQEQRLKNEQEFARKIEEIAEFYYNELSKIKHKSKERIIVQTLRRYLGDRLQYIPCKQDCNCDECSYKQYKDVGDCVLAGIANELMENL